jgi:patatin-like phospholipase/acyl hydrolase
MSYDFDILGLDLDQILMKEAALATAAAPTFFPPFVHRSTGKEYRDGGLFYNNPA